MSGIEYKNLNKAQKEAIFNLTGPELVIASAGTGKTTVLTYRAARIFEEGVDLESVLLLTFTNKAAREMIERINKLIGSDDASKITSGTYHSFSALLLRQYANLVGLGFDFNILDQSDSVEALKIVIEESFKEEKDLPKTKMIQEIFSKFRNMDMDLNTCLSRKYPGVPKKVYKVLEELYEAYTEYKKSKNLLDFDDLLTLTVTLLRENEHVARHLSDKYRFIMVDEYQDSNKLQFYILQELRAFNNKNLMVVGDEGQTLYSWRGADVRHIVNFDKNFPGCKKVVLEENYRSSEEIIAVANNTISQFKYKFEKKLVSQFSSGEMPKIIATDDKDREAEYIARKIRQLVKNGEKKEDIAVLVRNAKASTKLEILLNQFGFEFQKFGGLKFLERQYVKDILSFLMLTQNEKNEIAWFRILQLYPGIGSFYARKISLDVYTNGIEALLDKKYVKPEYGKRLPELFNTIDSLKKMSLQDQLKFLIENYYFDLVEQKIISSKIKDVTKREMLQDNKENREGAKVLFDLAKDYKSTQKFLTDITLEPPTSEDEPGDTLTISTVHSAKGLEFKHVFIMDCIDETGFPYLKPTGIDEEDEEALEEERRIFYVAITRAKVGLYLMYPKYSKDYYGNEIRNKLSRFITEGGNIKNFEKFKY